MKTAEKPLGLKIIRICAPTSTNSDEDIEKLNGDLEQAKTQCRQLDPLIINGDFNANLEERE